ncbi:MAG: 50S ribosomal protein L10 [Lentisphaerae bacterium GWF2_45_14]|nr:MAG: 50S ribosomal protein L10 [Lentisphaerae bacterium GWF2_45_14]
MRAEKIQLVNDIGRMLKDSTFVFFINYRGLAVKDFTAFRDELSKHKAQCHVLKNSLVMKAAEINNMSVLASCKLANDTAFVFGNDDAGAVAKVIDEFGKKNDKLTAKSGYMEGGILSQNDVKAIAALPPKEVLQAMLLGVFQAPARNFVSVLNAKVCSIVNVINAYKNKREEAK